MTTLDFEHGRRAVAEIRREVWPDCRGDLPEDPPTADDMVRYVELLEAAVAGSAMAMRTIGEALRP